MLPRSVRSDLERQREWRRPRHERVLGIPVLLRAECIDVAWRKHRTANAPPSIEAGFHAIGLAEEAALVPSKNGSAAPGSSLGEGGGLIGGETNGRNRNGLSKFRPPSSSL
jgi:hypothetical protein